MTAAVGSIRGTLTRLTHTRRARNGRDYCVAILVAYSRRQRATYSWKLVLFGRSLEVARRLPLGASVVARGEIYAAPATDPRFAMSMAVRDLVPFEDHHRHARIPREALDPRAQAEALFRPAQGELF